MILKAIGMSGLPGSGKDTLFTEIAQRHGIRSFSIGGEFRRRYKVWKSKQEEPVPEFTFWWAKHVTKTDIENVNEMARKMLMEGNLVLDSRYLQANCHDLDVPRVFVTANLEIRAERALNDPRYKTKSKDEMKRILQEREQDEFRRGVETYTKQFGHYDYRDPKWYDHILDTSNLTVEQEVDIVSGWMRLS